jgi:hypothetical protein
MRQSLLLVGAASVLAACAPPPLAGAAPEPAPAPLVFDRDRFAEQACAGLPRADEILCRADKRLIEARAAGDSVAVACHLAVGRELRAAARTVHEGRDARDEDRERAGMQAMERRVAAIAKCDAPAAATTRVSAR